MSTFKVQAVVIGAGPGGLFQVFQLGLHGIRAHVIDALPYPGGQCVELFAHKTIYDIPGVPQCTGRELVARLSEQIAPFSPVFHLAQQVQALQPQPDGGWLLETTQGTRLLAQAVVIAAGVGAFVPRTLKLQGVEELTGASVHYHPTDVGALPCAGRHVVVCGGGQQAVQAALDALALSSPPASVTLLHRRDVLDVPSELLAQWQEQLRQGRGHFVAGQPVGLLSTDDGYLHQVTVALPDGQVMPLPAEQLLVYHGLLPRLGPLVDWGLALDKKHIPVDTARFATQCDGLYAIGDINTYPGKRKLMVCAFHEATLAAFAIAEQLAGAPAPLEYTTGSRRLHERLGVVADGSGA